MVVLLLFFAVIGCYLLPHRFFFFILLLCCQSVSHRSSEVFVPVLSNDRERGLCELIDGEGEIFAELFK